MNFNLLVIISCLSTIQFCQTAEPRDVLIVTTTLNEPYVMISGEHKRNSILNRSEITGDLLEGYVIDLLKLLAEKVQFNYTIRLVKDSAYGRYLSGKWNGMIGEVIRGEADLAVADLTITSARERVVEFSYPFMTTGIGLLAKRPPYYSCVKNETTLEPHLKYKCHLQLYPVNEINDLANQNVVEYAALANGATAEFFRNSKDEVLSKIYKNLQQVPTNAEGIEKVRSSNGNFVLLMEGAVIEYLKGMSCDFIELGPNIHRRSYGIAMRNDYHMKTQINLGLLMLQETGTLDKLKQKWFLKPKQCDNHLDAVYAKNALNIVINSFNNSI